MTATSPARFPNSTASHDQNCCILVILRGGSTGAGAGV